MNEWQCFGKNIRIVPKSKQKVLGDTAKFFLYGDVVSVGEDVGVLFRFLWWTFYKKNRIKVGDQLAYTLFGINEVLLESGEKHYNIKEDDDFILEILKK